MRPFIESAESGINSEGRNGRAWRTLLKFDA